MMKQKNSFVIGEIVKFINKIEMDVQKENPELYDKVQAYVWKNYTNYTNKKLIIREFDSHFKININREDAPLVLGKGITS